MSPAKIFSGGDVPTLKFRGRKIGRKIGEKNKDKEIQIKKNSKIVHMQKTNGPKLISDKTDIREGNPP